MKIGSRTFYFSAQNLMAVTMVQVAKMLGERVNYSVVIWSSDGQLHLMGGDDSTTRLAVGHRLRSLGDDLVKREEQRLADRDVEESF